MAHEIRSFRSCVFALLAMLLAMAARLRVMALRS
jgi:hypothetical protein